MRNLLKKKSQEFIKNIKENKINVNRTKFLYAEIA